MGSKKYVTIYESEFGKHGWIPQYVQNKDYGFIKPDLYDQSDSPLSLDKDLIKKITFFTDHGIKIIRIYLV